nr:uncharacterized protein LOC109181117 [Ipomoea trifida]
MSAKAVMLSLISPRDEELCQGRPDYRSFLEAAVRYSAMGKALVSTQGQLEAESRARLDLEGRRGALNLHYYAEESYQALKTTRAGKQCVTLDGLHMQDLGEYDMQREIYSGLRRRDATFDPVAWGLLAELMDPEPLATPATSPGASGTRVATGADFFFGLTLGLGGAVDTALDQIHIPLGMADFSQAADHEARDS